MAGSYSAPTIGNTDFKNAARCFKKKCNLYIALQTEEVPAPPTTQAELAALIAADTGTFVPLGQMDKNIGKLKWTQNSEDLGTMTLGGDYDIMLDCSGAYFDEDVLDWLATSEAKGNLAVMAIPVGSVNECAIVNSLSLTTNGDIDFGGNTSFVQYAFKTIANELADVIKHKKALTAA